MCNRVSIWYGNDGIRICGELGSMGESLGQWDWEKRLVFARLMKRNGNKKESFFYEGTGCRQEDCLCP